MNELELHWNIADKFCHDGQLSGGDLMHWYPKQDRKEEAEEERGERRISGGGGGGGGSDGQIDWLCGMAASVAPLVMHPNSAEFRIRVLEHTALLRSAVLHRPCWRRYRLLWLD